MNYLMWGSVGFVFNKWIRSRMRGWWLKYNYILSASLDTGLAIGTTIVFFAVLFPQVPAPNWWGNSVVNSTLDYERGRGWSRWPRGITLARRRDLGRRG